MVKFPEKTKITIVDKITHSRIKLKDIILSVHLYATKKNDYYLGPFFSDPNGDVEINGSALGILAEAELQTGIMDYKNVNECISLVEIKILSEEEIDNLIKGRTFWGIIGREKELYNTKEDLLKRIKNNHNTFVFPQTLRVDWNVGMPAIVSYELSTMLIPKGKTKGSDSKTKN
jgi:hypothetical protein